jgi:CRP-like cAMP-binding protein
MMFVSKTVLRSVPLFSSLSDAELDLVGQSARQVKYPDRSVVFHEGDPGDFLLVLLTGRVKVSLVGEEGKEITLRQLGPPSFLGEMALLDGSPRSATVTTLEKTTCLMLGRDEFLNLMRSHVELMTRVLQHLTGTLRNATEQIRSLSMYDIHGRVIRGLLQLTKGRGARARTRIVIEKMPSHRELGELINCSRETVSRAMKSLERANYISITRDASKDASKQSRTLVLNERALRRYWPADWTAQAE